MPDDLEQMEARLAAYIDDALPPDQRAEIESYFKTNPSHARLITELTSIKAAVATLPRDKAPAEVLDSLQAHLERQSLLDGVEETASSARINRWPQLGAVAAMLLLSAGLGFLVYKVLPRGEAAGPQLALLSSSTRPDDGTAGEVAGSLGDGAGAGVSLRDVSPTTGLAADAIRPNEATADRPGQAGRARAMTQDAAGTGRQNQAIIGTGVGTGVGAGVGAAAPQAFSPSANEPVSTADASPEPTPTTGPGRAPPGEDARVWVVSSDDPALTQNLLAASLAAEGTRFELPPPGSAATRPATTGTAGDAVATAMAGALQTAGAASGGTAGGAARPVVVRNLRADKVDALRQTIDRQRPGRQFVVPAADKAAAGSASTEAPSPATRPTTEPAAAAAARLDRTTEVAPTGAGPTGAAPAAAGVATSGPATGPASEAGRDLVIFIVPTPPAPAAAVTPATVPATRPATGPAEEMP